MTSDLGQLLSSAELWRARDLPSHARAEQSAGLPTGFDRLDRLLPGQGWPRAALSEILCDSAGIGELALVASGLARLSHEQARWIAWINPPFMPHAPALAAAGIDVGKVLLIRTGHAGSGGQDALWALEQALESGACSAVLAWPDERRLRIPDLRRLHLRAQHGRAWAVLFRPGLASRNPSAAELRLRIHAAPPSPETLGPSQCGGPQVLPTCSVEAATPAAEARTCREQALSPTDGDRLNQRRCAPSEGETPSLQGATLDSGGIPDRGRPALDWAVGMRYPSDVGICSTEAFSLPRNGTPLTAKEQLGSPQAVSIWSMGASAPAGRGADPQQTGAMAAGHPVFGETALCAVRGRDALGSGEPANWKGVSRQRNSNANRTHRSCAFAPSCSRPDSSFMKAEPRRLLLSILKRRGGWGLEDLPLELEAGDDLEALLRLWRCR